MVGGDKARLGPKCGEKKLHFEILGGFTNLVSLFRFLFSLSCKLESLFAHHHVIIV